MSTSARRILDPLERYCSAVTDGKKIPIRKVKKPPDNISQTTAPSKGTKRKLSSLDQLRPNTTDLLRIKRKKKIQDSVSNARQAINSVCENTMDVEDSDASSDSVDLDYSSLTSDTNTKRSQKYVGKTRRKDKAFDHDPLPPSKLPNAVLKITNLPKFDITDTFTFSKPSAFAFGSSNGVQVPQQCNFSGGNCVVPSFSNEIPRKCMSRAERLKERKRLVRKLHRIKRSMEMDVCLPPDICRMSINGRKRKSRNANRWQNVLCLEFARLTISDELETETKKT